MTAEPSDQATTTRRVLLGGAAVGAAAVVADTVRATPAQAAPTVGMTVAAADRRYVQVVEEPLNPARYARIGERVTGVHIQAALTDAGAVGGRSVVQLRPQVYDVAATLRLPQRVSLLGANNAGWEDENGTMLKATTSLSGPLLETFNVQEGGDAYWHNGLIRDIKLECLLQASGPGLKLKSMGENTTVDRVMVIDAPGHGIHITDIATPVKLGQLSVHNNGRSGSGSGLCFDGSVTSGNYVEYVGGDNNGTALVEVLGIAGAVLHIASFKSERWSSKKVPEGAQPIIFKIVSRGGSVVIGSGRVHRSTNVNPETGLSVGPGVTVIHNESGSATPARVVIYGAIEHVPTATYINDYVQVTNTDTTPVTVSIPFNTIRGMSVTLGGGGYEAMVVPNGQAALFGLRDPNANSSSAVFARAGVQGDARDRFRVGFGGNLEWGPGGSAPDTNLYRSGPNTLTTDDNLVVGGALQAPNIAHTVVYDVTQPGWPAARPGGAAVVQYRKTAASQPDPEAALMDIGDDVIGPAS